MEGQPNFNDSISAVFVGYESTIRTYKYGGTVCSDQDFTPGLETQTFRGGGKGRSASLGHRPLYDIGVHVTYLAE